MYAEFRKNVFRRLGHFKQLCRKQAWVYDELRSATKSGNEQNVIVLENIRIKVRKMLDIFLNEVGDIIKN